MVKFVAHQEEKGFHEHEGHQTLQFWFWLHSISYSYCWIAWNSLAVASPLAMGWFWQLAGQPDNGN